MRTIYFVMMAVLIITTVPRLQAAQIVVLTEEPVPEFTLPDGSVLKNAYVWRRTSQGLMIIHDDGQFFMNYKTLPDAWRKVYGIDDSVEQIPMASSKRYDQYSLYPVLERIQGMPRTTVTFLESQRYEGQADPVLLSVCALQALLDLDKSRAIRMNDVVINHFTNFPALELDVFDVPCKACEEDGYEDIKCGTCNGGGACAKCGGEGTLPSEFLHKDPLRCTTCKGTGKCPKCGGDGLFMIRCENCSGKGHVIDVEGISVEMASYIEILNAVSKAMPWSMPVKETNAIPEEAGTSDL